MKKIVNVVWYKTNNVGDTKTSPIDYYNFPLPVEKRDIKEDLSGLEDAFVIIGGGGIIHLPSPDYNNGVFGHLEALKTLGKYRVMWGIGHNVYFDTRYSGTSFPRVLEEDCMKAINCVPDLSAFDLVGIRDNSFLSIPNSRYVPCASCKDPIFKKPYNKGIEIGAVLHEGQIGTPFPTIYCEQASFKEIIDFMYHFETIVTDSYHAMYWVELLGKKVSFLNVHSTKFLLHRIEPLSRRIARSDMFYNKVLELVYKYMRE